MIVRLRDLVFQHLRESDNRGEGGPDLVAHVRQENRLQALGAFGLVACFVGGFFRGPELRLSLFSNRHVAILPEVAEARAVDLDRDVVALQHAAVEQLDAFANRTAPAHHDLAQAVERLACIGDHGGSGDGHVRGGGANQFLRRLVQVEELAEGFVDQAHRPRGVFHENALVEAGEEGLEPLCGYPELVLDLAPVGDVLHRSPDPSGPVAVSLGFTADAQPALVALPRRRGDGDIERRGLFVRLVDVTHQARPRLVAEEAGPIVRVEDVVAGDLEDGAEVIGMGEAVGLVLVHPSTDVRDLLRLL